MIVLWQIDYWIFSLQNWYKNYLTICENKKLNDRWILKFTSVYLALVTREEFSHWSEPYDHPSIHPSITYPIQGWGMLKSFLAVTEQ